MATKNRYVEIPLDQLRKVRFTINAMRELENVFEGGITAVFNQDRIGYDQVTKILYHGLKHGDKSFARKYPTYEDLGDLLQDHWFDAEKGTLVELMQLLFDGLKAAGIIPEEATADITEATEDNDSPLAESSEAQ